MQTNMNTAKKKIETQKDLALAQVTPTGLVSDYPLSSVLVIFGIGLGAGVVLGNLLSGPAPSRQSLGQRTEQAAEQLGRQMLDAVTGVLPASFAKHISA